MAAAEAAAAEKAAAEAKAAKAAEAANDADAKTASDDAAKYAATSLSDGSALAPSSMLKTENELSGECANAEVRAWWFDCVARWHPMQTLYDSY